MLRKEDGKPIHPYRLWIWVYQFSVLLLRLEEQNCLFQFCLHIGKDRTETKGSPWTLLLERHPAWPGYLANIPNLLLVPLYSIRLQKLAQRTI
jgi:hypothetical protein